MSERMVRSALRSDTMARASDSLSVMVILILGKSRRTRSSMDVPLGSTMV